MIQVADGALSIIDEKLIRMKELAEQASTGTYDSTQRQMIDSEYQAMASEISRIARATNFNGIQLLDGSVDGDHDGSGLVATGEVHVHFGTTNDSAEDYYYVNIPEVTSASLGVGTESTWEDAINRLDKKFIDLLDKKVNYLKEYSTLTTSLTDAIYTAAQNWKDEFRSALESNIPTSYSESYANVQKFENYAEVKKLGDFPEDYADQPDRVKQKWEYAVGHASFEELSFFDKFGDVVVDNVTAQFNAGGIINITDPNDNKNIKTISSTYGAISVSGTATIAGTATNYTSSLNYDNNGNVTNITYNNYTFSRNTESGELTTSTSDGTITYDSAGLVEKIVNSDNNTVEFNSTQTYPMPSTVTMDEIGYEIISDYDNKVKGVKTQDYTLNFDTTSLFKISAWDITNPHNGTLTDPDGTIYNISSTYPNITVADTIGSASYTLNHALDTPNQRSYDFTFSGVTDSFGSAIGSGKLTFYTDSDLVSYDGADTITSGTDGTNTITFDSNGKVTKIIDKYHIGDSSSTGLSNAGILTPVNGSDATWVYEKDGVQYYYLYDDTTTPTTPTIKFVKSVDASGNTITVESTADSGGSIKAACKKLITALDTAEACYKAKTLIDPVRDSFFALDLAKEAEADVKTETLFTSAQVAANIIKLSDDAVKMDFAIRSTMGLSITDPSMDAQQYNYAGYCLQSIEDAQMALTAINDAMVKQEKARANLGALQNRLEGTIANLTIQAENLQVSESRISDVDVSVEMTEFVRQQILSQAAIAMLAQANSLPQMAMQLIGG